MNQYPISMPTNLIPPDGLNIQNEPTAIIPNGLPADVNSHPTANYNWVHCNDVPITFRSQLPSLPHARNTKARQVTNVIKRHNVPQTTDKII